MSAVVPPPSNDVNNKRGRFFQQLPTNHVPPYNVNACGDATAILGGTFRAPGPAQGKQTIGTYQSVINYESACGVQP